MGVARCSELGALRVSDGSLFCVCSCFPLLELDKSEHVMIDERGDQRWICDVYRFLEMSVRFVNTTETWAM